MPGVVRRGPHDYGPVLPAGAEIITMLKTHTFEINDSSLQLVK